MQKIEGEPGNIIQLPVRPGFQEVSSQGLVFSIPDGSLLPDRDLLSKPPVVNIRENGMPEHVHEALKRIFR